MMRGQREKLRAVPNECEKKRRDGDGDGRNLHLCTEALRSRTYNYPACRLFFASRSDENHNLRRAFRILEKFYSRHMRERERSEFIIIIISR